MTIFLSKSIKLTLEVLLGYSYDLENFHPDILIEAILIKKRVPLVSPLSGEPFSSSFEAGVCVSDSVSTVTKVVDTILLHVVTGVTVETVAGVDEVTVEEESFEESVDFVDLVFPLRVRPVRPVVVEGVEVVEVSADGFPLSLS